MSRIGHDAVHEGRNREHVGQHGIKRSERGLFGGVSDGALAGAVTGAVTRMLVQPFDVLKIRFQLQGKTPRYTGFTNCLVTLIRHEGLFRGLFKGWVPAVVKAFPAGAIQFYVLENSLYLIARLRNQT